MRVCILLGSSLGNLLGISLGITLDTLLGISLSVLLRMLSAWYAHCICVSTLKFDFCDHFFRQYVAEDNNEEFF